MIRLCLAVPLVAVAAAGCHRTPAAVEARTASGTTVRGSLVVRDTSIATVVEASGIAAPIREATLGTRLMGSVTSVLVHEGQSVHAGDLLARIDARDMNARGAQADAGVAEAEAVYQHARLQANRFRALYADSAAPKAQLDDAEAGLARAEAGLRAAQGAVAEVAAVGAYAEVRAPFAGTIVKRHIDPGAFVAPGAPLITIQDASRLRLSATVAPSDAQGISTGRRLTARIETQPASAIVEGVVPVSGSALYSINALVDNPSGRFMAGAAGTLLLPRATHVGIVIPASALVHEGDLTGAYVRNMNGTAELRWLRVVPAGDDRVEVVSGLHSGETIELPATGRQEP